MNYNYTKNCKYCNKQFNSQREDAKFCSSTCRVRFHKGKSKKKNTDETFIINVSNISNINNTLTNIVEKDIYGNEELEYMAKNKKEFLKLFLLAHKEEINELIYILDIFSEEEYAELSTLTEKAMNILSELEINPNTIYDKIPEIKKLIIEYEEQ